MLKRLLRSFAPKQEKPTFPIPELTAMLCESGFKYDGHVESTDRFRGCEAHRFSRAEFRFLFCFAYGMYGEDFIGVGALGKDGRERIEYLSFFIDYAGERNALRDRGLTHDEALAICLRPHVEDIVRLVAVTHSHGRVIPLSSDRQEALKGHA